MEFTWSQCYRADGDVFRDLDQGDNALMTSGDTTTKTTLCCEKYVDNVALFAGRSDGNIVIWKFEVKGHAECQGVLFSGHIGPVTCLEFMEGKNLLFSGSSDRTIKVWDPWKLIKKDSCIQTLTGHANTVTSIKLTIEKNLVSCSTDGTLRLYKSFSNQYKLVQSIQLTVNKNPTFPTALGIRFAEWPSIYVGESTGSISVYTCQKHADYCLQSRFRSVHRLSVQRLVMLADQSLVLSLSYENCITVIEANTGNNVMTIQNSHHVRFLGMDWDLHSQQLFTIDALGYVASWDIFNERCIKSERLFFEEDESDGTFDIQVLRSHINNSRLLVKKSDQVRIYNVKRDIQFIELFEGAVHTETVVALSSSTNSTCYSVSLDNSICVWDLYEKKVSASFTDQSSSEISCMTLMNNTVLLVNGYDDGSMRFWNPESELCTFSLTGCHANTLSALQVVDTYVISGGYDGVICVWRMSSSSSTPPSLHRKIKVFDTEIISICNVDVNGAFAVGSNIGGIVIYDLKTFEVRCKLQSSTSSSSSGITCMVCDGYLMYSGSEDGVITIWNVFEDGDIKPYEVGKILRGHDGAIYGMMFLDEVGCLASCGADGRIRFWVIGEIDEKPSDVFCPGRCIAELKQDHAIRSFALLNDSLQIICGTSEGAVLLCDIPSKVKSRQRIQKGFDQSYKL